MCIVALQIKFSSYGLWRRLVASVSHSMCVIYAKEQITTSHLLFLSFARSYFLLFYLAVDGWLKLNNMYKCMSIEHISFFYGSFLFGGPQTKRALEPYAEKKSMAFIEKSVRCRLRS